MNISNQTIAGDHDWCIAGGYAACPTLAQDMDVWVFGDVQTRQEILDRLEERGAWYTEQVSTGNQYPTGDITPSWRVAVVYTPNQLDRHIIVTSAGSIDELLDTFDISTHQCAFDPHNVFIMGSNFTSIVDDPLVIRFGTTTPERLKKITARYQHLRID